MVSLRSHFGLSMRTRTKCPLSSRCDAICFIWGFPPNDDWSGQASVQQVIECQAGAAHACTNGSLTCRSHICTDSRGAAASCSLGRESQAVRCVSQIESPGGATSLVKRRDIGRTTRGRQCRPSGTLQRLDDGVLGLAPQATQCRPYGTEIRAAPLGRNILHGTDR